MPKKKAKEDPKQQHEDFKRLAREIGADGESREDEVMRRLAQQKRRKASKGARR